MGRSCTISVAYSWFYNGVGALLVYDTMLGNRRGIVQVVLALLQYNTYFVKDGDGICCVTLFDSGGSLISRTPCSCSRYWCAWSWYGVPLEGWR